MNSMQALISKWNQESMPVFARTSKLIMNMSLEDNGSLTDITWHILKDSALTAKVLKLANSVLFNRNQGRVTTVSRAVLKLGLKSVRSMCISSALIDNLIKGPRKNKIVREMVKSFHAAVQARGIATARGDHSVEEVFIASLLYRIGHIAFWSSGGGLADKLEVAIKSQPTVPQEKVEKAVLGFSLQEITFALVKEWGLGQLLESSLSRTTKTSQSATVLLSQALASGVETGWESSSLEQAVEATSRFLKIDVPDVMKLIKSSTEEAIQSSKDYGLGNFMDLINSAGISGEADATAAPLASGFDALLQLEILSELNALIKDKQFNLNLYLVSLVEGISRGIGLNRVLLSIITSKGKKLDGRYGIGWAQDDIDRFSLSTKPVLPNLVTHLLQKREAVWVNARHNKLITEEMKCGLPSNFLAAPIVIKGKVIGAICADRSGERLDAKTFTCFDYFTSMSNAVLSSIL